MNPLIWVKLGAVGLVLALAFGGGCKAQASRDASKLAKKDAALVAASAQLGAAATALRQVSANTELEERKAAANIKAGREAAALAEREAAEYQKKLTQVALELVAAKRDPVCKKVLEAPACAALH